MKEKLNLLIEDHRRIVLEYLSILYIGNFSETEKTNSNVIRVLFLLNF